MKMTYCTYQYTLSIYPYMFHDLLALYDILNPKIMLYHVKLLINLMQRKQALNIQF